MDYKPAPFDASGITLSREILELRELLARNAHENWAKLRMANGWRHGPARDNTLKEHPDLIPFEQLPESEKEYDRQTALETIKTLLALGYTIQPPASKNWNTSGQSLVALTDPSSSVLQILKNQERQDIASLRGLWRGHDPASWACSPETYKLAAEKIIKLGEPLLGFDVVSEGIQYFPDDVRLRQLLALALARSGAVESANSILARLYEAGHRDEETLGLLARTHKDLAREMPNATEAAHHLQQAYEFYVLAFQASGGYWSRINAATLALVLNKAKEAEALAREVATQCRSLLDRAESASERYWLLSSLGEAALLLGLWSEAEQWYRQAVELGHGNWGSLQSTRHNAFLLLKHLQKDEDFLDRVFQFPSVVVFVGHMVDRPGRPVPRFPPQIETQVKDAITERLKRINAGFAYASVACGSDILFHEAMLERNGESHIVLPYEKQFFIEDSVDIVGNPEWVTRCNAVTARAIEIQEASKRGQICGRVSYSFANLLLHGLANVHARQLETKLVPLAVWDGKTGDGPDGTAGTVERWEKLGLKVEVIDLQQILSQQPPHALSVLPTSSPHRARRSTASNTSEFASEIRGLLFADARGFSELSDEQVPRFVQHFLGLAGKLASESSNKPLMKNTWGDGMYFVFSDVCGAGRFALDLRDAVSRTDWSLKGLPNLRLRIGVHAGPVYSCTDPVTLRTNYIGSHVSRAARIEPITPTGQVYASQSFAALAAAAEVKDFRCDYVGQTSMAKNYGTFPTYVVRRSSAGESRI